jgi:hypothetical protein
MKPQAESKKAWGASTRIGAHAPSRRTLTVVTLLAAGVYLAVGIAHADVPTVGDIAACNQEAREGLRGGTVSPIPKDEADADEARKARARTLELSGATGHVTQSPDPQIHGMDGEGAKDAAYRAAYRVCMRKNGF